MRTHTGPIPLENCIAQRTAALVVGVTTGGGALGCAIIMTIPTAITDRRLRRGVR